MDIKVDLLTDCFNYLDGLRMSGVTNMFGAASYLVEDMDLNKKDAKAVLFAWMDSYSDVPASERAKSFLNNNK